MSKSKSGTKSNSSKKRSKLSVKPKGLYPYQNPAPALNVAEPAVAYELAPFETSIEDTLALLSPLEQAEVLEVSPKTLTRWRNKGETLTPQQTDRIAVIEAIFKVGEHTLGSRAEVERWLHVKVFSLGGQRPIDLLITERGRRRVEDVLHGMAWGFAA